MLKFTLKVYPKGASREAYRILEIAGSYTLSMLSAAILNAFDFDFDHMYEFCMNNKPYSPNNYMSHPESGERSAKVRLDALGLSKGQNFTYHYDFGDDWMFTVHVQKIEEVKEEFPTRLIKSLGEVSQYPDWDEEEDEEDEDDEDDDWDEEEDEDEKDH